MARKPRDYDAELQALMDKAKKVKTQKTTQLGELVQVLGADVLPLEALAGALLPAASCPARRHRAGQEAAGSRREVDRTRAGFLSARGQAGKEASSRAPCSMSFRPPPRSFIV